MTIKIEEKVIKETSKKSTSLLNLAKKLNINWKTAKRLLKEYQLPIPSGQSEYHAKTEKTDRNNEMDKLRQIGKSYGEIGAIIGISRQRVYKILKKLEEKRANKG